MTDMRIYVTGIQQLYRSLMKVTHDTLEERINDADSTAQAARDAQGLTLAEIRDKVEENRRLISDGNSMKVKMLERWDWLTKLGSDLTSFMRSIMQSNFAIFHEVVYIRRRLATMPAWSLAEEPFTLEDAIGRRAPVHLAFITSWRAFDAVIDARFEGRQGHSKVKKGEYVLLEEGTAQEVDQNRNWELAVMPGQFITMSMLFRDDQAAVKGLHSNIAQCPYCSAVSAGASTSNVQW